MPWIFTTALNRDYFCSYWHNIFWSTLYMINIYLSQKGNHSTWVLIIDEWPLCLLVRAGLQPPAVQEQVCLHLSFSVNFQYFRRQRAQCLSNMESMITLCCKSLKSKSKEKKIMWQTCWKGFCLEAFGCKRSWPWPKSWSGWPSRGNSGPALGHSEW